MNTITIRPFAAAKLLTFAALALGGCHITGIRGNGHVTTETRTVPDFTSVEADGALTITWSNAPAALKITTDQNLLSHIETSVSGGKLRIHSRGQLRPTEGIKVTLSSSAMSGARLTGAVRLTATKLSGKGFYLEGTGATRVVVDGTVNELMATMSGASRLDAGVAASGNGGDIDLRRRESGGGGEQDIEGSDFGSGQGDLHRQSNSREAH